MPRTLKVLSRETIYADSFGKIIHAKIQRDETIGTYVYQERPDMIAAIPVTPDYRTVLVYNYRFPLEKFVWEICLGGIDEGEDPATAAMRELREETGVVASRAVKIGMLQPQPGIVDRHMHVYALPVDTAALERAACPLQMDEIIDVKIVSLDELEAMIANGEVTCSNTVCALYLLRRYLAQEHKNG
jgi:ADP-ribose pyrophosphatase